MDHVVSSLILSQFLSFFFFLDPLRPEAPGSLETCHVTFGRQCSVRRSKRGGGGADGMEMQKNSTVHNFHHQQQLFSSQPLGAVTGLAQAGIAEHASRLRSKQQNAKGPANKKIFPWMKESRHSDEKSARRIAGLCETKSQKGPFFISDTPPLDETSVLRFCSEIQRRYDQVGWQTILYLGP